jgi:hypothetical protein
MLIARVELLLEYLVPGALGRLQHLACKLPPLVAGRCRAGLGLWCLLLRRDAATAQHLQRIDAEHQPKDAQNDYRADADAAAAAPAHRYPKPATTAKPAAATAILYVRTSLFIIQPHRYPASLSNLAGLHCTLQGKVYCKT